MWLPLIGLFKSLCGGVQALFSWLAQSQLIDAGRRAAELEAKTQALKDMEQAHEIDSQPLPPDVLEFLRKRNTHT